MLSRFHILLTISLALVALLGVKAQSVASSQIDRGGQWLSWTASDRTEYVNGFLTGYFQGRNRACSITDELFETGKSFAIGNAPSDRCMARMDSYSKMHYVAGKGEDLSAYTGVITDFYTKYSQYHDVPFFYLMLQLTDGQYKTADQLYRMAVEGKLRTSFSLEK